MHCPPYATERSKLVDAVNKVCSGNVSSSLYLFGMWTKVQFLGCDGELSF